MNDINAGKIENTGRFKRLVSGNMAKLERKGVDAYYGKPRAKHLWTANWVPRFVGQDEAIYRRILLVEFTNQIPDDERDEDYARRLREDDTVRSVLLNHALAARERLREQGGFTNDRDREATRRLYNSWRDSNRRFLYEQFELTGDPDDEIVRSVYWHAYGEYCARKDYERKSNMSVTKALQYVPEVGASKETPEFYVGLRWRDRDAADDGDPDASASPPQHDRRDAILDAVDAHTEGDGDGGADGAAGVALDTILDTVVEAHGVDRAVLRSEIHSLTTAGALIQTNDDGTPRYRTA
jgi:phage/plasmid-associated DNA primase